MLLCRFLKPVITRSVDFAKKLHREAGGPTVRSRTVADPGQDFLTGMPEFLIHHRQRHLRPNRVNLLTLRYGRSGLHQTTTAIVPRMFGRDRHSTPPANEPVGTLSGRMLKRSQADGL